MWKCSNDPTEGASELDLGVDLLEYVCVRMGSELGVVDLYLAPPLCRSPSICENQGMTDSNSEFRKSSGNTH